MRTVAILAGVVALAACAPTPEPSPPTPQTGADLCRAADSQSLIGQNVAAVSFASDANVRVVCTTCPVTKDLRPDRLNVRFDQSTGIIRSVDCG